MEINFSKIIKSIFFSLIFYLLFSISAFNKVSAQVNTGCACGYDGAGTSCWECPPSGCTSDAQCGGGEVCCQGACVGSDQCGNSSSSCAGTVNCPSGWTPAFNQTPTKIRKCDQSDPRVCSLGTAQKYLGCCIANKTGSEDWVCPSLKYATYPCCPPGTSDQCVIENTGNTYVIEQTWSFRETCSESIDVFVKYEQGKLNQTLRMCDGEWVWNPILGRDKCSGSIYYYSTYFYNTTCQDFVKTCSCSPTCTAVAPSKPSLLSPADNSSITATTVNLVWDDVVQDWGTSCATNSNTYEVYVGTSRTSLALLGTVRDGNGNSVQFGAGVAGQTYYWKVRAKNGSLQTDSAVWSFTINSGPWWQTKDGDVTTNNDISSDVRTGQLFSVVGLGGFPGLPTYGDTFNLSSTPTLISTNSWNANTSTIQPRLFNYSYFKNLIPDEVINSMTTATDDSLRSSGFTYEGYEWFKANTSLTIESDIDFGNRKVILFVENGNLSINGRINLNNGLGFFGTFVNGSISVDPTVTGAPSIEGFFQADSGFSSGAGTDQLHIRGSVVSYGSVNLERDLVDNSIAGELFEFAPDLLFNFPSKLGYRRSKWTEVAP